ncbi:MAG: ATP-binding protein [Methanothrix sp.]|nr:ATP-binding protein [Methanothrix sp.]MCX8207176.1 ATP-binding protein [Methanothrix sp.]
MSSAERIALKSMPGNAYRILAKDVRSYEFIIPYDEKADVGEIFTVEDRDMLFLARVVNVQHDSNYDGRWDTSIRGTELYDEEQIFNRVIAEPLGCIPRDRTKRKGAFRKAKTIPTKFSRVKRTEAQEFDFLKDTMGDIEVGVLRNGSRDTDVAVALHSSVMDHHMGIFATTGMGKSNFMKVFAASCMKLASENRSEFGLLIVDPHGEYLRGTKNAKGLLHLTPYVSSLKCYSTDHRNYGLPEVSELMISRRDIRPEDIKVLHDWTGAQMDALESIERIFEGDSWIDDILDDKGIEMLREKAKVSEKTVDVLIRKLENIISRNKYIKSSGDSSIPGIIAGIKSGKVVLIDIPNLSESSELFLLSLISRRIMEDYRNEEEGRKKCMIVIEEAQRVLGSDSRIARFEEIAREGRKFGVGLCAITQQPKLIDRELLSQFNTLVVMGLADRNDRVRVEESAKQDLSSLDVEIQTLEKGEAIISTLNVPFPIPARIHRYEDYIERLRPSAPARRSFRPTPD